MRRYVLAAVLINVMLLIVTVYLGDERLPVKFDLAGNPIHFQDRPTFVTVMAIFLVLVNVIPAVIQALVVKTGSLRPLNIPYKSYWLKPENHAEAMRRIGLLHEISLVAVNLIVAMVIVMVLMGLSGGKANFVVYGIIALALILVFGVYRLFRPPN